MKGGLFRGVAWLTSLLPTRSSRALARPLAAVLWRLSGRLRRVSLANLALCFPERGAAERERLAREAMFHYACNVLEVGVSWFWSEPRFRALFEPPEGWEVLEQASAEGRGVLFLAPHFGAWEMLGLAVSRELAATLYKPGSDAEVDRELIAV